VSLPGCPCTSLDLLLPHAQELSLQLVACPESNTAVWISAPCGTFSRAMEHRYSMPLRSQRYRFSCPEAMADENIALSLRRDNALADFMFTAVNCACDADRMWFVCGAESSLLWEHPGWSSLTFYDLTFAGCAYGSSLPNRFRVRSGTEALLHLHAVCSKDHKHSRWNWSDRHGVRTNADKASLAPPKAFLQKVEQILATGCK
jgi:hypothetical protein